MPLKLSLPPLPHIPLPSMTGDLLESAAAQSLHMDPLSYSSDGRVSRESRGGSDVKDGSIRDRVRKICQVISEGIVREVNRSEDVRIKGGGREGEGNLAVSALHLGIHADDGINTHPINTPYQHTP